MNRQKFIFREKNLLWLLFFSALALFLLYHSAAYLGHFGFDDLHYADLATRLQNGNIDWNDHYSFRWTILGFTALAYSLFGINDLASSLPAMLLTTATLLLIFLVLRKHSIWAVAAGLAIFTFNHWTLFYSDKLMPDVYVAFFTTAAILTYFYTPQNKDSLSRPLLFAVCLFAGFLSKETIVLMIPLIVCWVISDLRKRRNLRFWLLAFISGVILLTGYFILVFQLTGDTGSRFRAITGNQYQSFCNYAGQPFPELLHRITYGLFRELTGQGMMSGFILLFPALFLKNKKQENDSLHFFATTAFILLLSSNFMTITPTAYNPMCTDPRHYLFLVPVFAIAGGLAFSDFITSKRYFLLVLSITCVLSLILISSGSETFFEQLLPLGLVTLTGYVFHGKKWSLPLCAVLLALVLAIKPARFIHYARQVNYRGQREFIARNIPDNSYDRIITDEVQGRLIRYYRGFRNIKPEVFTWQEAEFFRDTSQFKTALLTNVYTSYLSGDQPGECPFFATNPGMIAEPVITYPGLKMALYETGQWKTPRMLAAFANDFEIPCHFWSPGDGKNDSTRAAGGFISNRPGEFSATFRFPADSLDLSDYDNLLITCRFQCMAMEKTDAVTVISIGGNQGNDLWEAYPVFPQIKSFGSWSTFIVHQIIPVSRIKAGSLIGIYVWNRSRNNIYTDDWEISFEGWKK